MAKGEETTVRRFYLENLFTKKKTPKCSVIKTIESLGLTIRHPFRGGDDNDGRDGLLLEGTEEQFAKLRQALSGFLSGFEDVIGYISGQGLAGSALNEKVLLPLGIILISLRNKNQTGNGRDSLTIAGRPATIAMLKLLIGCNFHFEKTKN